MIEINVNGIIEVGGGIFCKEPSFELEFPAFINGGWISTSTEFYTKNKVEVPSNVPQSLTPRQIRKVLTDSGLRTAVENIVATSTDYDLKDWWEYSLSYDRTHPKLIEAAYALGLTDEQIDGMFVLGAML